MPLVIRKRLLHPLLTVWLVSNLVSRGAGLRHSHTDSFESYDYEHGIMDPHHPYGAPYGGYSRNTKSRLAALPLYLPETPQEKPEPVHLQIRDDSGKLFACRVYHEDELDPNSLEDSMFDAPKLLKDMPEDGLAKAEGEQQVPGSKRARAIRHLHSGTNGKTTPVPPEPLDPRPTESQSPSGSAQGQSSSINIAPTTNAGAGSPPMVDAIRAVVDKAVADANRNAEGSQRMLLIENRLKELKAICGQIHKGWWSYEWCHEQTNTQFHIEYDATLNKVQVQSVTDLGTFETRTVTFDLDTPNEWAEDMPELARVTDKHVGGGDCNGQPRTSYVHLKCCSEKIMSRRQGMVHKHGRQVPTDVAAVLDVVEDPDVVCTYNVTVCTPLLCGAATVEATGSAAAGGGGATAAAADGESVATSGSADATPEASVGLVPAAPIKENESISEILDRVLTKLCLQTNTGGWWTYEICHRVSIRQFHETAGLRRNAAGAKFTSRVVESEHVLGKYNEKATDPQDDLPDYMRVVNATAINKSWGDGNGAYYQMEYTGGDVCDHSDVTDSAIVAGNSDSAGGVERASTVRFFCGLAYDVAVSEDSTCHYVVNVKVPDLCHHALFRAPISKKQVVKCLPVVEENETEETE